MIIVRFTSGLGNQMYQYNFYRFLKDKYPGTAVKADLTWFYANNDHHGYELDKVFSLGKISRYSIDEASKSEIFRVTGQIPALVKGRLAKKVVYLLGPVNRILREKSKRYSRVNRIDQLDGNIDNHYITDENGNRINPLYEAVTNLDTGKDWYITGFFTEEHFYKNRIDMLKKEMIFPEISDEANKELAEKITGCNSVSIHVRRGDYLSDTYSSMFKCLGREYYEAAVKAIKEKCENPHFFIFSDDPEYIDTAFEWLPERTIVNINSGDNSFRDMQLMSKCKHNIIANSTFSQWGAILNKNEGHITVYPSAYLADEDTEVKTLPGYVRV